MSYAIRFPVRVNIKKIKKVCGIPDDAILINEQENIGVIRVETWEELVSMHEGFNNVFTDGASYEIMDEETGEDVWDKLFQIVREKMLAPFPWEENRTESKSKGGPEDITPHPKPSEEPRIEEEKGVSKTEKLNTLFDRWRKSYEERGDKFAPDGIIDDVAWAHAPQKLLFLLKETNKYPGDIRKHIVQEWRAPWPFVAMWAYGLKNVKANRIPEFAVANDPRNYKPALESSAVMNLKKLTGIGSSTPEKLVEAAEHDVTFINEELEIIQPDIVVCGGTFDFIKNIISGIEYVGPDSRCYQRGKTLWINFCHPSARFYPYDMMYYALMAVYQNYLRCKSTEGRSSS